MVARPFPDDLPVETHELPRLLARLSGRFLLDEPAPFAWPAPVFEAAAALRFHQLHGAVRSPELGSLPAHVPTTALAAGCPLAFVLTSDGEGAHVGLGAPAHRAAALAGLAHSLLGGPRPTLIAAPPGLPAQASAGCWIGRPLATAAVAAELADLLLDALPGRRFTYLVYLTPEPRDALARRLDDLRRAAAQIDRLHLAAGRSEINRDAQRAREALDHLAQRLETGLGSGLGRASVVLAAPDADTVDVGLAVLTATLGGASPTELPGQAHRCAPAARDGYSAHQNLLTASELGLLCPLPGARRERFHFRRVASTTWGVEPPTTARPALSLGRIVDAERISTRTLSLATAALCRHALVAGMTGSGKTTTVMQLLLQAAMHGLPFLVLDPVKSEYQRLRARLPELIRLRVGSVPEAGEIPFRFNPFHFPAGYPLQAHLDTLKEAFIASLGLFAPTPYLLETALHRVYERRGWNLALGTHPHPTSRLAYPTLSDLVAEVDPVVAAAGYDAEVGRNLRGALRTRLGNLCIGTKGRALDTRENLPEALLFERPVVIDLAGLGANREKAFVMGLILSRLYAHRVVRGTPAPAETLRHLLVIEEAHRLLRRCKEQSSEEGNMALHAVQTFTDLLAEIRAYGQGVVVVEQLPSKLAPEVVKNAGLKLLHRLSSREDRDLMGDAMLLDRAQKRGAATLAPGLAIVHGGDIVTPIQLAIPPLPSPVGAAPPADDLRWLAPEQRQRIETDQAYASLDASLRDEGVRRAADEFLFRIGCAVDATAARRWYVQDIEPLHLGDGSSSPLPLAAARQALERRALAYAWPEERFDQLAASLATQPEAFGAQYRAALMGVGPYAECRHCPCPCTARYEAEAWIDSDNFLEDLLQELRSGDMTRVAAWVGQHLRRRGTTREGDARALEYCMLRAGLNGLRVERALRLELLAHHRGEEHGE